MKTTGQIIGHVIDRIETEKKHIAIESKNMDGSQRDVANNRVKVLEEILKYAME